MQRSREEVVYRGAKASLIMLWNATGIRKRFKAYHHWISTYLYNINAQIETTSLLAIYIFAKYQC